MGPLTNYDNVLPSFFHHNVVIVAICELEPPSSVVPTAGSEGKAVQQNSRISFSLGHMVPVVNVFVVIL